MRTFAARWVLLLMFASLTVLAHAASGSALAATPPSESLGGLVPGVSTVGDAVHMHGAYDIVVPGFVQYFAGGAPASKSYEWSPGRVLGRRALTVETAVGERLITAVMVNGYPGIATSRGLMALMPESAAWQRYGMPDFAFAWRVADASVIELYYLDEGLLLVLDQVPGRSNWTITKIILTYPAYLHNAVALRVREALSSHRVEDITQSYRAWARMAAPAR